MTYTQKKDLLLEQIRNGIKMTGRDQILLVALLSVVIGAVLLSVMLPMAGILTSL